MHLNAVVAVVLVLLCGYHTLLVHAAQGVILLLLASRKVEIRGHLAGVSYHSREDCGFTDVQFRGVLAEIVLRSRAHAVHHSTEPDLVEVTLQNVDLGVFLFKAHRAEYLAQLTLPADLVIAGEVLDQLLRYRGTTAAVAVREERARGTVPVNALVSVETLVLGGDNSVDDVGGDILVIHPDAVLLCGKALDLDKFVVLVVAVNEACVLHLDVAEICVIAVVREIQDIHRQHRDNDADHDDEYQQHCRECRADYSHRVPEIFHRAAAGLFSGALFRLLLFDFDVFNLLFLVHTLFTFAPAVPAWLSGF